MIRAIGVVRWETLYMKKLLVSSAVLCIFSISILIFQASCTKEALAQSTSADKNIILYTMGLKSGQPDLWLANRDGSNKRKITLTVPAGSSFLGEAAISPDGMIIYLVSRPTSVGWQDEIWQSTITGAQATKLLDNSNDNTKDLNLLGVY